MILSCLALSQYFSPQCLASSIQGSLTFSSETGRYK